MTTASLMVVGTLNVAEERAICLCQLRNGRYVRLSQAAYDLVRSVEAGATFDEIAEVARRSRSDVVASDIETAYRAITAKLAAVEQRSAPKRGGFWLTFTLLPNWLVARLARPGATMYLVYPALYSDVTSAWALRRWQRVVVDLGGAYFQLIVATGFVAGYLATDWPALRIAVLLTIAACAVSLNPVMKFDGYWVVSDALGVTNLGRVPLRLGAVLWARMRGRNPVHRWHRSGSTSPRASPRTSISKPSSGREP